MGKNWLGWQDLSSAAMCCRQNPVLIWVSQNQIVCFPQTKKFGWHFSRYSFLKEIHNLWLSLRRSEWVQWPQRSGGTPGGKEALTWNENSYLERELLPGRGILTWKGNSPSLATSPPTIRPWPRWRASGKAGIGFNSWKKFRNISAVRSEKVTCAARAEPQRASRRSPMLTTPSLPLD